MKPTPNFFLGAPDLGLSIAGQLPRLAALMGVQRYALLVFNGQHLEPEATDEATQAELAEAEGDGPLPGIQADDPLCQKLALAETGVSMLVTEPLAPAWAPFAWAQVLIPLIIGREDLFGVLVFGPRTGHYAPEALALLGLLTRNVVLLDVHSTLRQMAREMIMATDSQRRTVANMMHDSLLQRMFLVMQGLWKLEKTTQQDEAAAATYAETLTLLKDAVTEIRALIEMQQPVVLERGLTFGLQTLCQNALTHGTPVEFVSAIPPFAQPSLTSGQTLGLFRIAEEALTNACQHSQATQIVMRLEQDAAQNRLTLTVEDNGLGFEDPFQFKFRRYGIGWMRERARMLQATITIDTALGEGTRVRVALPYPAQEAHV